MISFFSKIFIKNYEDTKNPVVREKYGILCGAIGIFFNIVLFLFKMIAGILSKSVAVTADAFNNLSDAGASIVTMLGFKLSGKEPDKDHPFGHGRIEYIAGLVVSFLILLMGFELFKSSFQAIIHPSKIETGTITIIVLSVSILVKLYMYLYNHKTSKLIDSATMEATATDSLNDTISTSVVLAVIIITHFFPDISFPLDGIAGLFVAVFILYGGYESVKETIDPLLGKPADNEFVKSLEQTVMKHEPICGIHDLIVHDYGPGRLVISLHAEVPGKHDIFELHDVIDNAEKAVSLQYGCVATIHMDPVDTDNPELTEIKEYIAQMSSKLGSDFSTHDVRMVPGNTHTNVIFDVVKPHNSKMSDSEIIQYFQNKISEYNGKYNCVVQIDNPYS